MMERKFHFHDGKRGAALAIRVTARARENKVIGVTSDGTVRVHLTAAASAPDFDKALEAFIADLLGVEKSRVSVVAGDNNDKLVSVLEMSAEEVHRKILENLE
jgi:uncharacterized protein YggU (UPF0235/DUF167 family)